VAYFSHHSPFIIHHLKHRFFIPQLLTTGAVISLAGDELHHARVARVQAGEEVEVFDGRGGAWIAVARELPSLELIRPIEIDREPRVALRLAMAIIALDKFELVLQKATELGVRSVIPLVTERVEVRPERYRGKGERWRKIVFEAVKQSGRSRVPVIEEPVGFADAIVREGTKIIFDMWSAAATPPLSTAAWPPHSITYFIGPEGGWSEAELKLANDHGCTFERLGPRRLRAETAAIAATALLAARSGDLG
jgi:16S rRNA (uracil1498-N3)-methyltransferase